MKKLIRFLFILLFSQQAFAQHVYQIRADSVRIYNVCDTAELIIENRTRGVSGFLYNKGNGRTEFRRIQLESVGNGQIAIIGQDTLDLSTLPGIGGIDTIYRSGNNIIYVKKGVQTTLNLPPPVSTWQDVMNNGNTSTLTPIVSPALGEGLKIQHDDGFISGYTSSGFIRNGFLRFSNSSVNLYTERNNPIYFGTNNLTRMTIAADGGVGINTFSPRGGGLDVNLRNSVFGEIPMSIGYSLNGYPGIGYNVLHGGSDDSDKRYIATNDYASYIKFQSGGLSFLTAPAGTAGSIIPFSNRMVITEPGNVGIGTTTPLQKLSVVGGISTEGNVSGYAFADRSGSGGGWTWYSSGGTARLFEGLTGDKLVVDASGKVGIGTTSPSANLDVNGTINSSSSVQASFFKGSTPIYSAGGYHLLVHNLTTNTYERVSSIPSSMISGGVSTSSTWQDVMNNGNTSTITPVVYPSSGEGIRIVKNGAFVSGYDDAGTTRNGFLQFANTSTNLFNEINAPMIFGTNALNRMVIAANGNVGIGTDTPGEKLHVLGNIVSDGGMLYGTYNTTLANGLYTNANINLTSATYPSIGFHKPGYWGSAIYAESDFGFRIRAIGGADVPLWNGGNDGAGSGLDADLFDGVSSENFVYGSNNTASTFINGGDLNTVTKSGFYNGSGMTGAPNSNWYNVIHSEYYSGNYANQIAQMFTGNDNNVSIYARTKYNGSWGNWQELWHSGNFNPANYALASGSGNYIQNQNASAQSANGWISGNFTAGNVEATNIVRGKGWLNSGNTGKANNLGISGGAGYVTAFDSDNGVYLNQSLEGYKINLNSFGGGTRMFSSNVGEYTYGTWYVTGERGNWSGIAFPFATSNPTLMWNAGGDGGIFRQGAGEWALYYNNTSNNLFIGSSINNMVWHSGNLDPAGFIKNQNASAQSANGWISGSFKAGTVAAGGATFTGPVYATAYYQSSLRSLKKNIIAFTPSAVAILNKAQVRSFQFKADTTGHTNIGFIADEVPDEMSTPGRKGVDQASTVGLLVKSVQELSAKNEALEDKVKKLEAAIEKLLEEKNK